MTNKEKLGMEPAFACVTGVEPNTHLQEGMSKHFYAACAAMQGMLANENLLAAITEKAQATNIHWTENVALHAGYMADELLKQEGANS
jgi:hypothetical protein